jgi:hypothetical protein
LSFLFTGVFTRADLAGVLDAGVFLLIYHFQWRKWRLT